MKAPTKEQLFDYLCRVNEHSQNERLPDSEFLFIARDGATCWGKTYAEAVRNGYLHDYELGNDKELKGPVVFIDEPFSGNEIRDIMKLANPELRRIFETYLFDLENPGKPVPVSTSPKEAEPPL